jgi:hypothetical protein
MLAMEREQEEMEEEEEERVEKALAALMERAKVENLRERIYNHMLGRAESEMANKRKTVTKCLNYFGINKNKSFRPNNFIIDDDNEDEDVVKSSSDDMDPQIESNVKKLKKDLPLTANDKQYYPEVRSLIEHGYFRRKHAWERHKNSTVSSFIDINKLDMDHQNVFPDYGEDLEKYLTDDDIQYLDRVDMDFFN